MVKSFFSTAIILLLTISAHSLEPATGGETMNPPIYAEAMAGNRAFFYSLIVDKKLQSIPKLGFFSVVEGQPEWGKPMMGDFMTQGHLTYRLVKGLDAEAGFLRDPVDGIRPSAGLLFSYGKPGMLLILNPRMDLVKNPKTDLLALAEFRPQISEKFRLYTRVQGLYSWNTGHDFHARSYVRLRLGLNIRDIDFGLASNFDFYGPKKHYESNFGGFVLFTLF